MATNGHHHLNGESLAYGSMIFNGLKGADLIIYNLLAMAKNRVRLSTGQIAYLTTYHPNTVKASLCRLEDLGMVERRRDSAGIPYTYHLKG